MSDFLPQARQRRTINHSQIESVRKLVIPLQ